MDARSRRSVLASLSGGTLLGAAGCLGTTDSVSVLSAGSLAVVLDDHVGRRFEEETGIDYHGEYYGANAVMRMIEDGGKHPDVAVSADEALLRDRLYGEHTDWDVAFASNSIGLAYAPDTAFGARLDDGEPWYEVALDAGEGELAISDPDLDPLGYRAMLAFRLAEAEHDIDGFVDALTDRVYREPEEPQLLAGVDAGNRAAAVAYRNMAVDHGLPFHEFPAAYDFSNPAYADRYGSVSYTTDEGYTATGRPIVYNATVLADADTPDAGREFVRFLADSRELLWEHGLSVDGFPDGHGNVPDEVIPE
ncbi:extracellular solute-binding protein [Halorubrum sp. DTA98]|uniref:extracellular solute-binding protein n=1 Tax=Halorubrum sp. DTA98 TaxID=3402163 RepID=UPI003AAADF38